MRWLSNIAAVSLLLASCSSGNLVEDSFKNMRESRGLIEARIDHNTLKFGQLAKNKNSLAPFMAKVNNINELKNAFDTHIESVPTQLTLLDYYKKVSTKMVDNIDKYDRQYLKPISFDSTLDTKVLHKLTQSAVLILTNDCVNSVTKSINICGLRFDLGFTYTYYDSTTNSFSINAISTLDVDSTSITFSNGIEHLANQSSSNTMGHEFCQYSNAPHYHMFLVVKNRVGTQYEVAWFNRSNIDVYYVENGKLNYKKP